MMGKGVFLIIDGLPPSSSTPLLAEKLTESGYRTIRISFTETLDNLSAREIDTILTRHLAAAASYDQPITIIAASFGAYVTVHSNKTLLPFADAIQHIHLYSPIAKLADVVSIETLADYLNKTYNSNMTTSDLLQLDQTFTESSLLNGALRSKTSATMGSQDSQIPLNDHHDHFRDFNVTIRNTGHIGMSHPIIQQGLPL